MKIAIVGAGICGLSTYLFLAKLLPSPPSGSPPHSILIYDKHPAHKRVSGDSNFSAIGGGLGLAANGMRVLRALDPEIHAAVVTKGYPTHRFQFKTSRGWTLGAMELVSRMKEAEILVLIQRQVLWECVREKVPDEVVVQKAIVSVGRSQSGRPVLEFDEGMEEVDLVVGADGVWSKVRETVVGNEFGPQYTGLYSVAGYMAPNLLPALPESGVMRAPNSPAVMTFGAEGFVGYGPFSTAPHQSSELVASGITLPYGNYAGWWSTFTREDPDTRNVNDVEIWKLLAERHAKWKDPVIQKVLAEGKIDVKVATWVTPKLSTWVADGVVLVGDAAHTLPSSSGQGVSCGLEDAYAVSHLLAHHLSASTLIEREAVRIALQQYEAVRKPHVERILDAATRMGDQKRKKGVIAEWVMYIILYFILNFFPKLLQQAMVYSVQADVERFVNEQR